MSKPTKILYAFIAVCILALVLNAPGMMTGLKHKKAVEAVFHDYSVALVTHDYERAFAHADEGFKSASPIAVFTDQQRELELRFGTLKSMSKGETFVHGKGSPMQWTALVEAICKYEKTDVRFVYEFHYEKSEWRLFGYRRL